MINNCQNFNSKTQAFPHQVEAINYIYKNNAVALFDEQGLGKTKIVIDALCIAMKEGTIEGALIIAPMSLLYNWEQEVCKHSFLIPLVLKGTAREKRYKFLTGANFYITNYEAVISENQRIKRFCRSRSVAIVLDESTRIKNSKTKTAQAIFQLAQYSIKRIIISGTPIANKPCDLWSQYYFLDHGVLLGNDFKKFKAKYDAKSSNYEGSLIELKKVLNANSIRRLKNNVLELPEKQYENIFVSIIGKQLELYEKLRKELVIEITNTKGEIVIDESSSILKKLLRLTQLVSNPYLIDKSYNETPAKFIKLDQLLSTIVSNGEKAVIWTSFVENIIILKKRYLSYAPLVIYGDIPVKERAARVFEFQNSERNKIMLLNPAAAREGITLTKANHAIYLDRNFNLVDYLQSQDRIHRISQEKPCKIYKLIAQKTIDEYIDNFVDMKSDIARFVQGDIKKMNEDTLSFLTNKSGILKMLGG